VVVVSVQVGGGDGHWSALVVVVVRGVVVMVVSDGDSRWVMLS
jgi:hypothetical protein